MSNDKLTDAEAAMLDADLALLMSADVAPELSAALSANILADAASVSQAARNQQVKPDAPRTERSFMASLAALWRPMSAGLAAAALGVWIGWADPAGMSLYADPLIVSDLSDPGGEVIEPADLFDLEL